MIATAPDDYDENAKAMFAYSLHPANGGSPTPHTCACGYEKCWKAYLSNPSITAAATARFDVDMQALALLHAHLTAPTIAFWPRHHPNSLLHANSPLVASQ